MSTITSVYHMLCNEIACHHVHKPAIHEKPVCCTKNINTRNEFNNIIISLKIMHFSISSTYKIIRKIFNFDCVVVKLEHNFVLVSKKSRCKHSSFVNILRSKSFTFKF